MKMQPGDIAVLFLAVVIGSACATGDDVARGRIASLWNT
jgi:hypothetical protein